MDNQWIISFIFTFDAHVSFDFALKKQIRNYFERCLSFQLRIFI
ncbi:hypothetical protein LEP1GSC074_0362 [Leptospira noguchii str. Hook]|nr:hypothetical protein LEP1GSC074_0362 [Leptospira noguchii str. Hook]